MKEFWSTAVRVLLKICVPEEIGIHTLQKYAQFVNLQNRVLQISVASTRAHRGSGARFVMPKHVQEREFFLINACYGAISTAAPYIRSPVAWRITRD